MANIKKIKKHLPRILGIMLPHKRPPQNVWPSKKFLSPRQCYQLADHCSRANLSPHPQEEATLLSCQLAFLAEASKKFVGGLYLVELVCLKRYFPDPWYVVDNG